VIIMSRNAINQNSSVVICVPITDLANCGRIYPSQVVLKRGAGGLTKDSVALCEQVRAITVDRLTSQLGTLDRQSLNAVDDRLKITLDLD
jgi:mRNA interferase MazF